MTCSRRYRTDLAEFCASVRPSHVFSSRHRPPSLNPRTQPCLSPVQYIAVRMPICTPNATALTTTASRSIAANSVHIGLSPSLSRLVIGAFAQIVPVVSVDFVGGSIVPQLVLRQLVFKVIDIVFNDCHGLGHARGAQSAQGELYLLRSFHFLSPRFRQGLPFMPAETGMGSNHACTSCFQDENQVVKVDAFNPTLFPYCRAVFSPLATNRAK